MANILKKIFVPGLDQVAQTYTIESWHISQSIDALTGAEAYDLTISGSLTLTGSLAINGLTDPALTDVLTIDTTTGQIYYTSSTAIAPINNYISSTVTNNYTSSTVNNNFSTSSVVNNYTASTVNNPGGLDTYIQYNSGSTFGGDIYLRYNYAGRNFIHGTGLSLGGDSFLHGDQVTASNNFSHAEGSVTQANGYGSHAEGSSTISQGSWSHTEGLYTIASGDTSHAEGDSTTSFGQSSHAEGYQTLASGEYSHAEGNNTVASGPYSHAEGYQTISQGTGSHAEGRQNLTSGDYSYASGFQNTSSGNYSFTTGNQNKATNTYTFAAGLQNTVSGIGSATFGYLNNTSGLNAFSIGNFNSASGQYSFASGQLTKAQGIGSFTSGYYTSASGDYQIVVGTYNELNTSPSAFIVGGGTGTTPALRKTLVFASGSQFQLSGSFAPQYRNIATVVTSSTALGVLVTDRDYNVTFAASNIAIPGFSNKIQLPSNVPVGTVIYLQRTSGTSPLNVNSAVQISGSSGYLINGAAGYTFPLALYARRMFVFSGALTGWYTDPVPLD